MKKTAFILSVILAFLIIPFLPACENGKTVSEYNIECEYADGKLVGRLPEFALCGNVFDVYGKNYLGACSLGSLFKTAERETVVVAEMNVVNKK